MFITDAVTYERAESTREFFLCGRALGHFQQQLAEYPVERLAETIPDFHHTPKRLEALKRAAAEDVCGRNSSVRKELRFFLDREEETAAAVSLHAAGKLPLRVTHNDTKLNNILFDKRTGNRCVSLTWIQLCRDSPRLILEMPSVPAQALRPKMREIFPE